MWLMLGAKDNTVMLFYGFLFILMQFNNLQSCEGSSLNSRDVADLPEKSSFSGQAEDVEHMNAGYNEYPMIVPKRSLLNSLLRDAVAEDMTIAGAVSRPQLYPLISRLYYADNLSSKNKQVEHPQPPDNQDQENSIQRRAHKVFNYRGSVHPDLSASSRLIDLANDDIRASIGSGDRNYWRCYFNAISCF